MAGLEGGGGRDTRERGKTTGKKGPVDERPESGIERAKRVPGMCTLKEEKGQHSSGKKNNQRS